MGLLSKKLDNQRVILSFSTFCDRTLRGGLKPNRFVGGNIAKPEPAGFETIDECLQRQKHLNQSSPQPTERKKQKQKKQSQLEL